jgi:hypothetical protein
LPVRELKIPGYSQFTAEKNNSYSPSPCNVLFRKKEGTITTIGIEEGEIIWFNLK